MNKRIDKISSYLKLDKLKNDKRVVVFLICLFIASALWFLNALGKDYSTTISYPVRYVGAPNHQFLANEPPTKLDLKVDAHGFTLLRHKLSLSFSPIILNLSNITRNITPDNGNYYVQSAGLLRRVSSQVTKEISISEIQPEIILIALDSLKTKEISVRPDIELTFKPQFNLKSPMAVEPQSVKITGPAGIIDTLQYLRTEFKGFKVIDANIEHSLSIIHPEKTTIIPGKVLLKTEVEKFTEKELKVPIQIINKPDDVNVKLFPSDITVLCLIGLSNFDALQASDFTVTADYNSITPDNSNLSVQVISKPSHVELLRFAPESIEFLIETY